MSAAEKPAERAVDVALDYARRGLPVFPCGPDKRPLVRWRDEATADEATVNAWWQRWSTAMVGLPTGSTTGLFVVDLDVNRETGECVGEASAEALGIAEALESAPSVRTPSGGRHFYFSEEGFKNTASRIGPGIDTRGEGGFVIAPGSVSPSGAYDWIGRPAVDRELPPIPGTIRSLLVRPADRAERPAPDRRDEPATDAEVEAALAWIDPDCPYDAWISVLQALHAHFGAAGLEIADGWSQRGRKYEPGCVEKRWRGFSTEGGIGIGTLFKIAADAGADLGEIAREHGAGAALEDCGPSIRLVRVGGIPVPPPGPWPKDWPSPAEMKAGARPPGAEAQAEHRPLFSPASMLADQPVPPRAWHVEDLIPSNTVTMIGGAGGTGKSLLALQLAVATATRGPWIGLDVVAPGRALFMSAEDDRDELHRRLDDITRAAGVRMHSLDDLLIRSLAGEDALLAILNRRTNAFVPTPIYSALDDAMAEAKPTLVVLDTLADLHSGEEEKRAQARQFVGLLRGLAIRHSCAVVVLAHPSLNGISSGSGLSGSTAWDASVRSRLYLERITEDGYEPDPDARRLRMKKANYGPVGGEFKLTWRDGALVADRPATGIERASASAKAERVFLTLLQLLHEQGRRVSAATGPTYAPKVFAENPQSEGVTKRALAAAMEGLLARGAIKIVETGPPSKRRSSLLPASLADIGEGEDD
ncbi:MAG: AAA family ATPase [Pseudomonadota bacterium]